jgi:hypothetical protein
MLWSREIGQMSCWLVRMRLGSMSVCVCVAGEQAVPAVSDVMVAVRLL